LPSHEVSPPLARGLRDIAPGQANIRQLTVSQGRQLTHCLAVAQPMTEARENSRKKHDATSTMGQCKRNRAAHRQREKRPLGWWPSLGRKPVTGAATDERHVRRVGWEMNPEEAQTTYDQRTWNRAGAFTYH
jgi:hypothetical protein